MKSQKMQKGIVIPLLALGVMLVLGGVLYYYSHKDKVKLALNENTAAVGQATSSLDVPVVGIYTPGESDTVSSRPTTVPSPKPAKSKPVHISRPSYTASAVSSVYREVSGEGVLAERLGWNTYTNRDWSYAVSFPQGWGVSGGGAVILASGPGTQVSVSSVSLGGEDLATFAVQSGATGASATTVNGYPAVRSYEGGQTVYYIENGAVGYRIAISGGQADVVRAILLTFTFVAQR
jgi:hypothetical protein